MIRRSFTELKQSVVSPTPDKAILAQTADGIHHSFYPQQQTEDGIEGTLSTFDPTTGERNFQTVSLPHGRLMEAKEFVVRHRTGEIVAAVSLGAIVTGTLIVRHFRNHS